MSPVSVGGGKAAGTITAVTLLILLLWMFQRTVDVFLLLFIAVILSLYLGAVRDALVSRAQVPARVAFAASVFLTIGVVVGLFWLLVPAVFGQTRELVDVLPTYITSWEASFDRFVLSLPGTSGYWKTGQHQVLRALYDQMSSYAQGMFSRVFSIVGILIDVFSVFVMSIYLALQPGVYREWLIALFPPRHRDLVRDILRDVAGSLLAYIVGQLTTMTVLAILTAFFLWVLNVPYWLTFGVFTGMVAIVPFFGSLLSTTLPAAFVLTGPNGGTRALLVLGVGVIVHLIEGNLVSPLVMSKQVELPPVLTIMAVLVVGSLLGPLGLVVALPTLAMVMVVVRRILINRIYEGKGFRKGGRDRKLVLRVPVPDGGVLLAEGGPVDMEAFKTRLKA
ncbi:MAG: AI-2E family transporter [Gemmatimonadota bacterium]